LAFEAEVAPVIILTKSDLCEAPDQYVAEAGAISDQVPVVVLDARGEEPKSKLADWCRPGQTLAFLGSSGVGKSTLINTLSGTQAIETQAIREDDAKGRHTTTSRQLHILPDGCAVLDTPGMRELQLTDVGTGVADVFSDLHALSTRCRFNDCQHETEPGCAVRDAIEAGEVDTVRLARWQKLVAEDRHNSASLAQRKSKDKALGKTIRQIQKLKKK
ncbi:MAG: ribosome small subunit-dependent GTPase A, partial [Pseudomonadota bacterium]